MNKIYTGKDLIRFGIPPGSWFPELIVLANILSDLNETEDDVGNIVYKKFEEIYTVPSVLPLQSGMNVPIHFKMDIFTESPRPLKAFENVQNVKDNVDALAQVPVVREISVMPDACPAGVIPVGVVATTEGTIHPGFHSADICCSMFLTTVDVDKSTKDVLDAVESASHFGPGGRDDLSLENDSYIMFRAKSNMFLRSQNILDAMSYHMGTQGDGNHFFFVGRSEQSGQLTFVTHHGSRKPGALLFKAGMKEAQKITKKLSPDTPAQASWIPFDTEMGQEYWEALNIIRLWTKMNHRVIHTAVLKALEISDDRIVDRFWNEHNFVFKHGNFFDHAKGATPLSNRRAYDADEQGRVIIPLNMNEPILIAVNDDKNKTGYAPHGAGRNYSRTFHKKLKSGLELADIMKEETKGIDVRFYSGKPDISELPSAYKDAASVQKQIESYHLAKIVDKIMPLGTVMAGEQDQPWRKK